MYDAHDGIPVQSATLAVINPGAEVRDAQLQISHEGKILMTVPLETMPARSAHASKHLDSSPPLKTRISSSPSAIAKSAFKGSQKLKMPAYHSYFDGGTFDLLTTNHNDLGWLDTQKVTADYRSAELILPAMEIMKKYPDFRYSMESVDLPYGVPRAAPGEAARRWRS